MKKIISIIAMLLLIPAYLGATTVEWDPNLTADWSVVYWGFEGEDLTEESEKILAPVTEYNIPNPDNKSFAFAVKSFNNCGNDSGLSEIAYYICEEVSVQTGVKVKDNGVVEVNVIVNP